jgi:hypothetical protein
MHRYWNPHCRSTAFLLTIMRWKLTQKTASTARLKPRHARACAKPTTCRLENARKWRHLRYR